MSHPIGIIGGSGLYAMEGLQVTERSELATPFGPPSGPLVLGAMEGVPVAFLARHGEGHRLLPHEVPYRANLWALKKAGARVVISFSAVAACRRPTRPAACGFQTSSWTGPPGARPPFSAAGLWRTSGSPIPPAPG